MKIHVNASRIQSKMSTSIGYVLRDNQTRSIIGKGKQLGDCPIIVAKFGRFKKKLLWRSKD